MPYLFKRFKLEEVLIIIFPFLIISGPAIPDITAFIIITIFIYKNLKYKNYNWGKNYWVHIFLLLNFWFILTSFFSYNFNSSITDSLIFIRFILFIMALKYFIDLNKNIQRYILYSILLAIIFVTLDTLFQFYNYSSELGFQSDFFGIKESGLYGRLNGPFKDYIPGSYLSRFYFFIFIIMFTKNNIFENKYLFTFFLLLLSIALSTIYFTGEPMALCTTLLGLTIIFIYIKKFRKFIINIILISLTIILINKYFHPFYNDYKIINNSSAHEGLIIERSYQCNDNPSKICKKIFKKQPSILTTLNNFKNSPYGEIYITAFEIWKDNWFTGIGLNNFEEVCKKMNKYNKFNQNFGCGSHPHNFYIQAMVETGLPGLILFSFLIFTLISKFKDYKKNHYALVSIIVLLTIFWPIMSTGSFLKNGNMIFITFLLGVILGTKFNLKYFNDQ